MLSMIIGTKKRVQGKINSLDGVMRSCSSCPKIVQVLLYTVASFGRFIFETVSFVASIPIFMLYSPQQSFEKLARRKDDGQFLDSYSSHLKRYQVVVGVSLSAVLAIAVQLSIFGLVLYHAGKPTVVHASVDSKMITASWGATADNYTREIFGAGKCRTDEISYECNTYGSSTIKIGQSSQCPGVDHDYAGVLTFNLSTIPSNATITDAELLVNVTSPFQDDVAVFRTIDDDPYTTDPDGCDNGSLFSNNSGVLYFADQGWSYTGPHTFSLEAVAVSDIQTRISTSKMLGLYFQIEASVGSIASPYAGSGQPQLHVTYTLPSTTAPSNFNKGTVTTTSIPWSWTDNDSGRATGYNVKTSTDTNVTGCTGLAGSARSCTETGLAANTRYTRHATVTDALGSASSDNISVYTAYGTPSGILTDAVSTTSITVHASGTFTNLGQGQSALMFSTNDGKNSGWITTSSWTISNLLPNSILGFTVRARNGDGVETAESPSTSVATYAPAAAVVSARSDSTWYQTGSFSFTNALNWGSIEEGGVQYYGYAWDQTPTHAFTGSESTWSTSFDGCPNDVCTVMDNTLSLTASAEGLWYLHLLSYNALGVPTGTGSTFGPYEYDHSAPTAPTHVYDGSESDLEYTASATQLVAHWTASSDVTSGIQKYQYAIGTTSGGTNVVGWTDNGNATSLTKTNLSLTNGDTYYVSVRAVDRAANIGAVATTNGVTVDTDLPPSPAPVEIRNSFSSPTKYFISETGSIEIEWSPVTDETGIHAYQYAIGTTPGGDDVVSYADDGVGTTHTESDLNLADGGQYYVSVRAVDGVGNTSVAAISNPVIVDTTPPSAPPSVNDGSGADATFVAQTSALSANWTAATDASSGIQKYQYAIGTSAGTTDLVSWTDATSTTVTVTGLTLANGATYFVSVRAIDNAGNVGTASVSNGMTVNIALPQIVNHEAGLDATPRATAGTVYDVDFTKSSTGPDLSHAEYAVYAGAAKTGTLLKDWTSLFSTSTSSYTTDWSVDFAALQEGTNHVSVRVTALDGLVNELDDAFTIVKNTSVQSVAVSGIIDARVIAGETVATFFWTTTAPSTSRVSCGDDLTEASSAMTTSHRVQIDGLTAGATYGCTLLSGDSSQQLNFITNTPSSTKNRAIGPTILEPTLQSGTTPKFIVSGVAKGHQTIRAYVDGKVVKTVTTKGSSIETTQFTIAVSLAALKMGTHVLYLQSTDENGRTSIVRQRVTFVVNSDGAVTAISKTTGTALTYTVKKGDSLWRIAQVYLGDGSKYTYIIKANQLTSPSLQLNPSYLRQGMVLVLPKG